MQKLDLKDHVTKETKGRFVERKKRNGNGVSKCGGPCLKWGVPRMSAKD